MLIFFSLLLRDTSPRRVKEGTGHLTQLKTDPCFRFIKVKQGKSGIWLFLKIPLWITISIHSSRRGLNIDMVVDGHIFKNNQIPLFPCYTTFRLKSSLRDNRKQALLRNALASAECPYKTGSLEPSDTSDFFRTRGNTWATWSFTFYFPLQIDLNLTDPTHRGKQDLRRVLPGKKVSISMHVILLIFSGRKV